MEVKLGVLFGKEFLNFPEPDRLKILGFIMHVEKHGLNQLEGRNKSSDNVDKNDPNYLAKVRKAQEHKLWHYHIGIAKYDVTRPYGARTSEFVLHYKNQLLANEIKIADMSGHPPFRPPTDPYLV